MNLRLTILFLIILNPLSGLSQLAIGVYVGLWPARALSSNTELLAGFVGHADYQIKPERQGMTWLAGSSAFYHLKSGFYFAVELQYRTSVTQY